MSKKERFLLALALSTSVYSCSYYDKSILDLAKKLEEDC